MPQDESKSHAAQGRPFKPAKPEAWFIGMIQTYLRAELALHNRVIIPEADLDRLRQLPANAGLILTPNHADENDPPVCLEISRQCGRRFIFMGNREAFDEYAGLGGWVLQRMGVFSVERGGHDAAAKNYACDVVKNAKDVLVIFPEGEIFYLNESVQPFHSGAIDIGLRAVIERRQTDSAWTAFVVPMAIKYRYAQPMKAILERRVSKMEKHLSLDMSEGALKQRITTVMTSAIENEESFYDVQERHDHATQMSERLKEARKAILQKVEDKYAGAYNVQSRTLDRAFQLSAHVRELMAKTMTGEHDAAYKKDLAALKEVRQMGSWQPQYIDGDASVDRLAEMVIKLEREVYRIKRPRQFARREVHIRVGEPIDLSAFLPQYHEDAYTVRKSVTDQLRGTIQSLINDIVHQLRSGQH